MAENGKPRRRSILKNSNKEGCDEIPELAALGYVSSSADENAGSDAPPGLSDTDDDEESIHVKFQNIQIRNYEMTLGDNPAVSYGPPVSLGWEYYEVGTIPLEDYEESRGARRKASQMLMNPMYRKYLLQKKHFTQDELDKVVKEMKSIKKGRERTKMMLPFLKIEEAAESAKRKAKRAV